jgi:lysophospholipase L1-like esterase
MRGIRQQAVRIFVVLGFAVGSVLVTGVPVRAAPGYVALGDSYSSGVGTRSYYDDGTTCKRSPYAFPVLAAGRIGAALTFAACSGAKVPDVGNQLGSLSSATRYVTVSVGGNDAGFAPVIIKCAQPWPTTCWGAIDDSQAFIQNTLPGLLDGLYSSIRAAAPNARVVVVGYPRLFNGEECNLAARISPGEQAELNATADRLAATIGARAAAHGFAFADARSAYSGHSVCDDVEWINGLSNPISESYHPNRGGQVGYANLVEPVLRGSRFMAAATPQWTRPRPA